MSWNTLPPDIRLTAEQTLTPKQLDVWKLHLAGCSGRRIANMLRISRDTVRGHLDATHHKLAQAGIQPDHTGRYHQEEPQQ